MGRFGQIFKFTRAESFLPTSTTWANANGSPYDVTYDRAHYSMQADVLECMQFLTSISTETTATKKSRKIFASSTQPKVQEQPIKKSIVLNVTLPLSACAFFLAIVDKKLGA